jgi:hypothetical protein
MLTWNRKNIVMVSVFPNLLALLSLLLAEPERILLI